MQTKNETGSAEWTDPDDAPPLTAAMLDDAEFFHGNTFIKRGRGRPPTGNAKEHVSLRLDQDVLAKLREAGPGWQSQVSSLLRQALHIREIMTNPNRMVTLYEPEMELRLKLGDVLRQVLHSKETETTVRDPASREVLQDRP